MYREKPEQVTNKKGRSLHPGGLALTLDAARAAGMTAGDKVLDIGCGNASSLAVLRDAFGVVPSGTDLSEKAVRFARELHPEIGFTVSDARALPYAEGSFDHVMMECVLTLLDEPAAALREAVRVLRPGGSLILSALTSSAPDDAKTPASACRGGLAHPAALTSYLERLGLTLVHIEDRKADLTQYVIDSIMEFGSLEERIRVETELVGGSVFDCNAKYDRKTTGYHLFVFRKASVERGGEPATSGSRCGTPVDALVAERLGAAPADLTQKMVEEYQLQAFRRTMKYAMNNSRFYGERFRGLDPDEIRSMADLKRIPTTSEADLAGNEWQFQCLPASDIDRVVTVPTSGTSGKRKRIVLTAEDQEKSIDFINRGFLTQRCTRGERMIVFMSGTTEGSIGDLVIRAMAPLEMDIKVYGAVTDIADAYQAMTAFRPGVVEALPWHAAALARYGTQFGNPERDFIRSVNLSADVVPDAIVNRLETLWDCTVHRHYGTTEMAIFGGVECEYHQGYHTRPCDILYEIPEPDNTGYGEMYITTLDRKALPLLRYRTGDIARFIDTPCPCGCRIRRIERFLGRRSSRIELPAGSFFLSELADALYRLPPVVDFDVTVSAAAGVLEVVARTLPGDSIRVDTIREALLTLPSLSASVKNGSAVLEIKTEETRSFPSGYNLKKKVIRR